MKVQFRSAYEDESVEFADIFFDKESIDNVIPLLERWGVFFANGSPATSLAGQFEVTKSGLVFVVVAE